MKRHAYIYIYILMHKGENGALGTKWATTSYPNSSIRSSNASNISLIPCRGATSITIEGGEG